MTRDPRPFRVLTIDGGGIRGIIPAAILAFIENQAGRPVAELFDLVVGTSTGGILSLGLTVPDPAGRPKFSAGDLEQLYATKGVEFFQPWDSEDLIGKAEDRIAKQLIELAIVDRAQVERRLEGDGKPQPWWKGLLHPKYSADGLIGFLQSQLGETLLSGPVAGIQVAANSFDLASYGLKMFRSWEAAADPARDFPMWAVGRATSAAPTFFPPAQIVSRDGATTLHCIDGGVAVNDPVLVGYAEARRLQATLSGPQAEAPILVVSVGTGRPPDQAIKYDKVKEAGIVTWFLHGLMDVLIDGPNAAANRIAETLLPAGSFYRFQAPLSGPGFAADPALDDCSAPNIQELRKSAAHMIKQEEAALLQAIDKLDPNLV